MSGRYDLAVVGGGTAGLVAAIGAAGVGARVCLVERASTGGDCLWTGCVPSKTLLATAALAHRIRHADALGLTAREPELDFRRVMLRVRSVQETIAPHDSVDRLRREGVEVVTGQARFVAPGRLEVDGGLVTWRRALIATGSQSIVPDLPGLHACTPLTTETLWDLDDLPRRLVVLGGGPVGCELAQAFARLGSRVTLVEMGPRLLDREEPEAGELVRERLRSEGVDVRTSTEGIRVETDGGTHRLVVTTNDGRDRGTIRFDRILVAAGRRPTTAGLGLRSVGVRTGREGQVIVDDRLRTTGPGVFAAGDVTGGPRFTHVAAYQAGLVVTNALFGLRRRVSYEAVPWATFTDPEVGRVGLTEAEARARWGDGVTVARADYGDVDRAVCAGDPLGFAKLVAGPRARIVGATVAGPAGGEATAELAVWIRRGGTLADVAGTVHAYPTFTLGVKRAADEHLRQVWLSERVRRFTRPVLGALRLLDRLR